MNDRNNTIAGWVLFAGIIALGGSIVAGEMFHSERPEKMGFPIEGVVEPGEEGAAADDKPFAFYMASGDAAKGEQVFKKCAACHNADQGGPNALGPNLWGVVGKPHAAHPGFAYSDALTGVPGSWTFDALGEWLANPKKYAPGTKMTFAGLANPQDRADVIAFLNAHGSNLPLPTAPAEGAAPAEPTDDAAAKPGSGPNNGAQKAEDEPVLSNTTAAKGGGDASPKAQ